MGINAIRRRIKKTYIHSTFETIDPKEAALHLLKGHSCLNCAYNNKDNLNDECRYGGYYESPMPPERICSHYQSREDKYYTIQCNTKQELKEVFTNKPIKISAPRRLEGIKIVYMPTRREIYTHELEEPIDVRLDGIDITLNFEDSFQRTINNIIDAL